MRNTYNLLVKKIKKNFVLTISVANPRFTSIGSLGKITLYTSLDRLSLVGSIYNLKLSFNLEKKY